MKAGSLRYPIKGQLRGELGLEPFVDLRRIGFAFAGFHDLADEGVEGLFLAGLEFFDIPGVGGQHFVDEAV